MTYRAIRRWAVAMINGLLISTAGAKLVPARPKSLTLKRLSSTDGETRMRVSHGGRHADVSMRNGTTDWRTFDQIFICEDYDLRALTRFDELRAIYDTIAAAGETPLILDLGANAGFSPVYFHLVWPAARIVAVEPDTANLTQLRKNVEGLSGIDILPGAISSRPGQLQIDDPLAQADAVRVVETGKGKGPSVPAMTVPQIFEQQAARGGRPWVVKIDIEGAEADLFSEDIDWIDEVPLLIVELHDWLFPNARPSRNFLAAISDRERDFVYLGENIFSIRNGDTP